MPIERLPRELRKYRAWALANRIPDGVRNPAFLLQVQRIMRSPLHECPGAQLLVDGEAAFQVLLAELAKATDEILLETYILRDDKIGDSVHAVLAAAVRRGVRVHVLADAIGSSATRETFWQGLQSDGITLRLFKRFPQLPFDALRRDHRKIVVIDRHIAFTGGMNIGEEYGSSIHSHDHAWRDTLVRVEGTIAFELAAVFAEGWDRADGPALPGLEYVSWEDVEATAKASEAPAWSTRALRARVNRILDRRRDRRFGRRVKVPSDTVRDDDHALALVLDARPRLGQREVLAVLASLVGAARKSLWITTPYFAPPTRVLSLLRGAARRGVDVRLLVPGERTDVALVRHAAHGAYRALLDAGVRIFEYQAATLHSKTVVVDAHAGVIGSTNLDFRSFWLNAECNILLFDDVLAAALEKAFIDDCARSIEITTDLWSRRSMRHQLGDWLARSLRWAL
jgi:cardiolipin synthase